MYKKLLEQVYKPSDFNLNGHVLIDQLTSHLEDKTNASSRNAINWNEPEKELEFWKKFLIDGNKKDLFSGLFL